MSNTIAGFVAASDNANEYADERVNGAKQAALEDIDGLMSGVEDRDAELWYENGVDAEVIISDYDDVPVVDRGIDWVEGVSGIAALSGLQYLLDNREELIFKPAAYRSQVMDPFNLTRQQLVTAGKREVMTVTVEGYQKLQAKYLNEFQLLRTVPDSQLYNILQRERALQPIEKLISNQAGYVSRMTNYPSGSPQFKEAVADLVNTNSTTALKGMNRRSVEGLSVERQLDGEESLLMAWVLDPSSSHCTYCPDRAGEVRTYAEWVDYGLPGAGVCRGGDKCNCHLVVV